MAGMELATTLAFDVLGIPTTATADVAKRRYRDLCQTKHPDKGGDPAEFRVVNKAYLVVLQHVARTTSPLGAELDDVFSKWD